ncbi:hypothetical protein [Dongia deserti]|uniref:hypothetical protein n=1 Tax=Dongia deserti TaxID=2268030 RepID=UPI0013C515BE|nr:hypothetical protein [Dongia deserti]
MRSPTFGARRTRASLAATLAALLALSAIPASADDPTAEKIQADAYLMARLRAGQSWDSPKFSITEMRPGTVDQGHFAKYIQEVNAEPSVNTSTLEMLAALGPQIVTEEGDILMLQTASASWGDPGIMPRSHLGADGVWEFPRRPDKDELDMLDGQRWRIVENVESQILFLGPDQEFGWDDFADLVNPLQHIPLISIAYRAITGDKIYGAASLIDVGFGPLAGAGTIFQLAYQSTTGTSLEDQAVAAVFGPRATDDLAGLYTTTASRQVADRQPVRRGSNQ